GAAPDAIDRRVSLKMRSMEDDVVWLEIFELGRRRADEHVPGEQGVPRARGNQAHLEAGLGIGPGIEVLGKQLLPLQIGLHAPLQSLEPLGGEALVDLAPPNLLGTFSLIHNELVLSGAAGMNTGLHDQRAISG